MKDEIKRMIQRAYYFNDEITMTALINYLARRANDDGKTNDLKQEPANAGE